MTARRMVLLLHRWAGLGLALFLLVAGATGCVLVFRPELDARLNPDLFQAPPGPVLPGPELARRLLAAHPDWVLRSFPVRAAPGHALRVEVQPVQVSIRGRVVRQAAEVFLNPRDGTVSGARSDGPGPDRPHLFAAILSLHYALLAGTGTPGQWLMGIAAALWLALNLLGLVITWPRRAPLLRNWVPRWGASRHGLHARPLIELHRVTGLWLLLPLTVLAYTSAALNFYDALFAPAVEALSPPPLEPTIPVRPSQAAPISFAVALEVAERVAATRTPALAPATMSEDKAHDVYGVTFSPGGTPLYRNAGPVTFYIGRHDGRLAWIDQPTCDGWGRVLERTLYPLHSGQVLGLPTRLLVLALGLVTVGLAVTGFLPWWKRWHPRRENARTRVRPPRPSSSAGCVRP